IRSKQQCDISATISQSFGLVSTDRATKERICFTQQRWVPRHLGASGPRDGGPTELPCALEPRGQRAPSRSGRGHHKQISSMAHKCGTTHPCTSWPRAVSRSVPKKVQSPHPEGWDDLVQSGYPA
ncbi:unnamed protein product, partial [Timema podura]|nr:unnamed protein product [Timema podura]